MPTPITSANFTAAVVKLFSTKIPEVLKANLIMGGLVNRSYDDAPGNIGNLVHVPLPPGLDDRQRPLRGRRCGCPGHRYGWSGHPGHDPQRSDLLDSRHQPDG